MNLKSKNIIPYFLLYIAIFLFGLFVIYVFQYHYHTDLLYTTRDLANHPDKLQTISSGNTAYHGLFFFQEPTDTIPTLFYCEERFSVHQQFLSDYIVEHDFTQSNYRLSMRLHPFSFFAIASSPVYKDSTLCGTLYVAHTISYLPSVLHTFFIFYTIIFSLFMMHLCFIHKINRRITDIYRKYIANISHELKSPIASIHAITETLTDGLVTDEETLQRYYGIIDRESHRLEQSVLDIIQLSKIQEHRIDISKKMTPISEILFPLHKRYHDFCEDIGITFSIDSSALELPDVFTNADRIIQLMQLLIDNAVKFTSEGGEVTVSAEYNEKYVTIKIHDTGCGMDEETITHIFERFYRGTNTNEYAGSGLGLSIAQELVLAMNEKIWATSELGVGSDFYFTISRKKSHWKSFFQTESLSL